MLGVRNSFEPRKLTSSKPWKGEKQNLLHEMQVIDKFTTKNASYRKIYLKKMDMEIAFRSAEIT